jgi:hypothetical protein
MKFLYVFIALLIPFSAMAEDTVSKNKVFVTLKTNEKVTVPVYPVKLILTGISDSLCPKDVQCIWQGELRANIKVIYGGEETKCSLCFEGACALMPAPFSVPDSNIKIYAEKVISSSEIKVSVSAE